MSQVATYIDVIERSYPDFAVRSAKANVPGQNNDVLLVNEAFIFRFPKYAEGIEQLATEVAILKGIRDYVTLPIPHITFEHLATRTVGQAFVGYRLLVGEPLSRETFSAIQDERILEGLAHQLAQFLRELHHVPVETAIAPRLPVSDTYQEWSASYGRIREKCFPLMRLDAQKAVTRHFETFLGNPAHFLAKPVLKHGDFGTTNILVDLPGQVISGILDFGGAGLGDPAYDFAGILSSYGEVFLRRCVTTYPEIEVFWDRITFYQGTFALLEALFGIENQDQEAVESGIADYR